MALALAIPFFIGFVWAPGWPLALVFLAVPMFFNYFYLSPAVTLVQEEVQPHERVLAGALLLLVMNLIGLGLGPDFPRRRQRLLPAESSAEFTADGVLYAGAVLRAGRAGLPVAGACVESAREKPSGVRHVNSLRIAILLVALGLAMPAAADTAVVNAPAGKLQGATDGKLHVFKGIPYALPPIGALRWKPPLPVPKWKGTRDATQVRRRLHSAQAAQPDSIYSWDLPTISEDCLYAQRLGARRSAARRRCSCGFTAVRSAAGRAASRCTTARSSPSAASSS